MGLDLNFNYQEAIDAGLETRIRKNGTTVDIYIAKRDEWCDSDHVAWLEQEELIGNVPNSKICFLIDLYENSAFVRANKWGRVYAPLTEFLSDNGIGWEEDQ